MPTLTPEGRQLVRDLAERHGFGEEAVARMLAAVVAGQGRMAQFDHPEFGGSGQWMSGGMLMLGDMFNQGLKGRVDGLCNDLSNALASIGPLDAPTSSQSQSQGRDGEGAALPDTPFFTSSSSRSWWPPELGTPSATGSQDTMRYAYFADARRLAIDVDGDVRVHDTLDHRIGGFAQQQGGADGISVSSQHGTVDLATLPIVSGGERASRSASERPEESQATNERSRSAPSSAGESTAADESVTRPGAARSEATQARSNEPGAAGSGEHGPGTSRSEAPSSSAARDDGRGGARDVPAPARAAGEDPVLLIERLGQLRERGLLTDEEFTAKKQELLSRL